MNFREMRRKLKGAEDRMRHWQGVASDAQTKWNKEFHRRQELEELLKEAETCLQEMAALAPPTHGQWVAEVANKLRERI
jgi:hypothetical protein